MCCVIEKLNAKLSCCALIIYETEIQIVRGSFLCFGFFMQISLSYR